MGKIKLSLLIIFVLIAANLKLVAQINTSHTRGLYLTLNDYLNHKLNYETNSKYSKIYIHEFLGRNTVTVINNGKMLEFSKSELFGYHDNNDNDYRFFNGVAYQIIDTKGFYLYSFDKLIQQGKGPKPSRTYYFSTKANSELLLLTQENIDRAFAANHKFRNLVQSEFKVDNQLNQYDNAINEYKIKELYAESSK